MRNGSTTGLAWRDPNASKPNFGASLPWTIVTTAMIMTTVAARRPQRPRDIGISIRTTALGYWNGGALRKVAATRSDEITAPADE